MEGNETVVLDISDVVNGTENGTQQTITIIDDDSQTVNVYLSVSSSSIAEAAEPTVSAILMLYPIKLLVIAASGTATGGGDYTYHLQRSPHRSNYWNGNSYSCSRCFGGR